MVTITCEICGAHEFAPAEYASDAGRAPALECTRCKALILDERAAYTEEERESVKLAKGVRAAIADEEKSKGRRS